MTNAIHLDFETRSRLDLRDVGVYAYAEDPSTRPWGFAYSFGAEVRRWTWGEFLPEAVIDHAKRGGIIKAHNAAFERIVWNIALRRDYPLLPELAIEQMDCTLVRALAINLPADLDTLGRVLSLSQQKDKDGHALMLQMCAPRKELPNGTLIWWDEPEKLDRLMTYCEQDIRTEIEADRMLPALTDDERTMWHIDQRINDRGVPIDVDMVQRAGQLLAHARDHVDDFVHMLTDGAVSSVTSNKLLMEWLERRGVLTYTMRKGDYEWLLQQADIIDDPFARAVIELRRTGNKVSTAKYDRTLQAMCKDMHVRGLLQFDGAAQTGRWAGRLVQPQNYARVDDDEEAMTVEWIVGLLKGDMAIPDVFELIELRGPPRLANGDKQEGMATLPWLSKSLRSTIATNDHSKFLGGDFSNIEGRVNAWLAGETWKIKAFEDYDAGVGPDLYKLAFSRGFGVALEDVSKPQRQIGKVMELACGYQGGVGAFLTMTQTYLLKIMELMRTIVATTPTSVWDETARRYDHARDKHGLAEDVWTALKIAVTNWRVANPAITASWKELQDAALHAVTYPGVPVSVYSERVRYLCEGQFLYCSLPSGRVICYPQAHISTEFVDVIYDGLQWVDADLLDPLELVRLLQAGYEVVPRKRSGVRFFGLDERRRWIRQSLYGGFQAENIIQATSCCLLRYAMREAEAAGFPLILTVHDEILAELEAAFGNVDDFARLMQRRPQWALGLPIMAKAWTGNRYDK